MSQATTVLVTAATGFTGGATVEKIGGRPPTTLEEFITKHRQAFA